MDMFDPRYQLEAEEPIIERHPEALIHMKIQHALLALEQLAWRLRGQ